MRETFLYVIKMQSVWGLYLWFHMFQNSSSISGENLKMNSLNTFFAQKHKADVAHNLVVLSIRMFQYCSLLLDFDKFGTGVQ
jgi:hypothetical protein